MRNKTLEMHNLFVKSKPRSYYTLYLSCFYRGVVYHIRHVHVLNFSISSLKRVVQKRQSLSCNLEG
jgi:hypothetical protein